MIFCLLIPLRFYRSAVYQYISFWQWLSYWPLHSNLWWHRPVIYSTYKIMIFGILGACQALHMNISGQQWQLLIAKYVITVGKNAFSLWLLSINIAITCHCSASTSVNIYIFKCSLSTKVLKYVFLYKWRSANIQSNAIVVFQLVTLIFYVRKTVWAPMP